MTRKNNKKYIDYVEKCAVLLNKIQLGIFITDNKGKIIFSNSGITSISQTDREHIENAIINNDCSKFINRFEQPIQISGMPLNIFFKKQMPLPNIEIGYLSGNEKTIWINVNVNSCEQMGLGTIITYYDITGTKKIQAELKNNRNRYKKLLSDIPITLIVHKNGKILYSNPQIYQLLGYRPFELTDENMSRLISNEYIYILDRTENNCELLKRGIEIEMNSEAGIKKAVKIKQFNIDFNGETVDMAVIKDITKQKMLEKDITRTKLKLIEKHAHNGLIGKNKRMIDIINILPGISSIGCNVLLEGETGTGKNMIARTIHDLSDRKKFQFVDFNCAAIPESLFESELFGYVKGAFTDARNDKKGKFAIAEGGTVFLDEISEIPLTLQVKLLKIIEEKSFEPLGSVTSIKSDIRIIAATNRDLKKLVADGKFREDLYYRLKVVCLTMPPLRDRRDDIELLAENFIRQFNELYSKKILGMTENFYKFLYQYDFPGNIRELRNIIERACIFCENDYIDIHDLAEEYKKLYNKPELPKILTGFDGKISKKISRKNIITAIEPAADESEFSPIEKSEKETLIQTLKEFNNDKTEVMKYLNISRMTLWRKMKKYGIL